ncbi:hypothetical protein JL720_14159 [Aureococcus anophagefferens]|nr:hypothetical protein JL720_14159 [Aureococcus anophagefferens]
MAFRTSAVRFGGAVKAGVQPHLEIWWKKKPSTGAVDGMTTQMISPFELQPTRSLWEQFGPANFLNNFPSIWDIGPGAVALVGTHYWADCSSVGAVSAPKALAALGLALTYWVARCIYGTGAREDHAAKSPRNDDQLQPRARRAGLGRARRRDAPRVDARASKGLPADPATWDLAEVGTFVAGIVGDDCDDKLVERFRAERVDGAAMLGLNEALLERHFSDASLLGDRLRILKGVAWAARASEEAQHPGLRSLLGQGFGVVAGVAGAAMAPHLAESFGADGNARDWQIDLFKKARDGIGQRIGGLVIRYEVLLILGGIWVSWIPPGAQLVVLLPILFAITFEVFVWTRT